MAETVATLDENGRPTRRRRQPRDTGVTTDYGRPVEVQAPSTDQFTRVSVVEEHSHGTLPTDVVLYLAGLDDDNERLARLSKQLARRYEIPPLYLFGTTDPKQYRDPFTGEPLSIKQAQRFTNNFGAVAVASILSEVTKDQGGDPTGPIPMQESARSQQSANVVQGKLKVEQVANLAKVLSRAMGDEVSFEKGMAMAVKMARDGIRPRALSDNLAVVKTWADAYGGMTQDDIFGTAVSLSAGGKRVKNVAELQEVLFGKQAVADRAAEEKRLAEASSNYATGAGGIDLKNESQMEARQRSLVDAGQPGAAFQLGPDYWSEVTSIQDQLRLDQEAFDNSLMGQALNGVGRLFEHSWNFTQKGLVTVGSVLQGAALPLVAPFDPQGDSLMDNYKLIQQNHAWAWQRIEEGNTVGDFVQQGYGLPEWTSPAFDFLVGWYVDPLVVAGKISAVSRAKRVLPGTLEKLTLPGVIASKTPGVRKIWELEMAQRALRQEKAWARAVPDFAASNVSKKLFEDAYKSSTNYFRRIERLRGVYEARGTLDVQYMKALRDKVTQRFPNGGAEAREAWDQGIVAHFTGKAPEGTVAAEVVQARAQLGFRADGIARDFTYQPKLFEETQSGQYIGTKDGYVQLSDDVITNANGRAILVPGELSVELPGKSFLAEYGPRRVGRTLTTHPRWTEHALGRRSSRLINYNPGRAMSFHDAPEQYTLLHARRWAQFDEPAVRRFESEAIEIVNSGHSVEARLTALIEKIDKAGFDSMMAPYNVERELQEQIFKDIFTPTYQKNYQERVFGVSRKGPITDPILESQLVNTAQVVDPIAARQYVRRLISMRTRGTQYFKDAMALDRKVLDEAALSPDALQRVTNKVGKGIAEAHSAYLKFWKAFTVARPAYVVRVIGIDENARFLATAGSLTERMVSMAYSRSGAVKKNLLARKVDDMFGDVIKVGDESVPVLRSGAYEYEALAAGRVRESEVLEEVLRQAAVYDKAMRADGGWKVLDAVTDRNLHKAAWSHALRKQFRQSAPGRAALESIAAGDTIEATERALMRWAKEDGFTTLTGRIGVDPADVELWASDLASMAHAYTTGSKDIAEVALTGSRYSLEHALEKVKIGNRPKVHGPSVEQITDGGFMTRQTNRLYETFVRLPEDALNRQPFYRVWKQRYDKAALRALSEEGANLTPAVKQAIDNAGRKFALGQVRRVMFDFTKQSRFTELLQWFAPFPQPFFESFQAWGHIAWRNPEVIGRAQALWRLGKETGFLKKDSVSGEWMMPLGVYRGPALVVNTLLGGDNELLKQFGLLAPVSSMNTFINTTITAPSEGIIGRMFGGVPIPVPGLDPVVAAGMQKLFGSTRSRWLSGWLFQYGPTSPIRMVPSQLQAPLRSLVPELFEDESSRKSMRLTVTQALSQMGLTVDDEGNPLSEDELTALVDKKTDELLELRAYLGLVTPTQPRLQLSSASEDQQLFDTYMTQYGDDYFKATEAFLTDHPDKYFVPASRTRQGGGYSEDQVAPRINPSELVHELYRTPGIGDFMKDQPQWAALMLIGTDPALEEEFNFSQYSEMIAAGVMRYKDPAEYLNDAQAGVAYREIDQFYKEIWNPGIQAMTDDKGPVLDETDAKYKDLKAERSEFYRELSAKYPQWGMLNIKPVKAPDGTTEWTRVYGGNPRHIPVDQIREDAMQIASIPGIRDLPGPRALRTYLEGTDELRQEMSARHITDITSDRAKDAGLWSRYQTIVKNTINEAPDIEPFLRNYFGVGSRDGEVTYTEDLVYEIGEGDWEFLKLDDQIRQRYVNMDSRLEELRERTRAGFDTTAERSAAYLKASQFMDQNFREDPKTMKAWWAGEGYYYRQQYKEGLVGKPVTFFSAFDFAVVGPNTDDGDNRGLTGLKLTKRAGKWLNDIAVARVKIAEFEERDPVGYSESAGYEAIDAFVRAHKGKDDSFDKAIAAANTWGWALEQRGYTQIEGKVGHYWGKTLKLARDVQAQVDRIGLSGQDFGTDAERAEWDRVQKEMVRITSEWRKNSPAFDRSWKEIQEITGEPIIGGAGLLMPDTYFGPLGRVDN